LRKTVEKEKKLRPTENQKILSEPNFFLLHSPRKLQQNKAEGQGRNKPSTQSTRIWSFSFEER